MNAENKPAGQGVLVRMPPDLIAALDEYRRGLKDIPTRPEAIRRIVQERLADNG